MKKLLLLISIIGLTNLYAADAYVSTNGDDGNDGLSWSTAKATLGAAKGVISGGGTIYMAAGTYEISEAVDFNAAFNLFGGYLVNYDDGTATRPVKIGGKSWELENPTILKGVLYTGAGTNSDNKNSRIITVLAGIFTAEINGITFKDGQGVYKTANATEFGGALHINSDASQSTNTVIVRNCTFENNFVNKKDNTTSNGGLGGAILVRRNSLIENCYFKNNKATGGSQGGGGAIYTWSQTDQVININNCEFDSNYSDKRGGAINAHGLKKTILKNSIFYNNTGTADGAILYFYNTSNNATEHEMENCLFYNNSYTGATASTGIVMIQGGTVRNCTFVNNKGTVKFNHNDSYLYNSVVWGNIDPNNSNAALPIVLNGKTPTISYCASNGTTPGIATNHVILNNINDTNDDTKLAPYFISPTTFAGAGDLSAETINWQLQTSSPLKASGSLSLAAGATDIVGFSRPISGSSCSIGAYEYNSDIETSIPTINNDLYTRVLGNNIEILYKNPISVNVYSTNGQLVYNQSASKQHNFTLQKGLFIVKAGDLKSFKVLIP